MLYVFLFHLTYTLLGTFIALVLFRSIEGSIIVFICLFMFPVGGMLMLLAYSFYWMIDKDSDVDADDLMIVGDNNYKFYSDLNIEEEINVLPLNDVLSVSDNSIKRERFLETIKKDIRGYTKYVKLALENEDGETSHYAAAIIQETKRKMDVQVHELMALVDEFPEDMSMLISYADFLVTYLAFDQLQSSEKKRYAYEYIKTANKLILLNKDEKYIMNLINILLENEEYEKAKSIGNYFISTYIESINMYIMNMKIYYVLKDRENLAKTITTLRESNLVYDSETLNKIRFWIGDVK